MWCSKIILQMCVVYAIDMKHVIKLTPKLRRQGYHRDINLGQVVGEATVDSPEACGKACLENAACNSSMLMGRLCRMFSSSTCPVSFTGPKALLKAGITFLLILMSVAITNVLKMYHFRLIQGRFVARYILSSPFNMLVYYV